MKSGINGLGRIGKLSLWHHVSGKHLVEIPANASQTIGCEPDELIVGNGRMEENCIASTISRFRKNPNERARQKNGVQLAVDTTGVFTAPTADSNPSLGTLRGHLQRGAERVMLSSPFKIQFKEPGLPVDAAKALPLVIPETVTIGFMADPVGIPKASGSRIIPAPGLHDIFHSSATRKNSSTISRGGALGNDYQQFTEKQIVPWDILTAPVDTEQTLRLPGPQSVVYGWYDNESGCSTTMLGDVTVQISTAVH